MKQRGGWIFVLTCIVFNIFSHDVIAQGARSPLTLRERIEYQRAIESVYWRNRIWPKENVSPKPSLEEVLSPVLLRGKAEDSLRKSQALDAFWHRPITPGQLRAEMERMERQSRNPAMLAELFAALGNDSYLIEECLARPLLADRLIRNWYAHEDRIHGNIRLRAMADLAQFASVESMRSMSGKYRELIFAKAEAGNGEITDAGSIRVAPEEWQELAGKWKAVENGRLTPLQEDADRFYVAAILEKSDRQIRIASVELAQGAV